ncbi:hypothetical protein CC80DRAFT_433417 [Byssothecium circinans]|uniref:Developmental regulator protein n=1 Tax=Byssothecium circinans TaxID=147558 RepID=A0A6A5UI62_9PLEO|nr:hypothetical protein CC80DRAFT_433417 [Byssothecium circinans]
MPTWLVHGFRWPRKSIRIHIILQNLEACAPGWIMSPDTVAELMDNFYTLYPERMRYIPNLRFIEQYDPDDMTTSDQPYAYVCDQVHEIKLGVDVDEIRSMGVPSDTWNALVELRNELAPGEKLGWFVVVNGDVERWAPPRDGDEYEDGIAEEDEEESANGAVEQRFSPLSRRTSADRVDEDDVEKKKGFKAWIGKVKKARSSRDLRGDLVLRSSPPVPPLPNGSRNTTSLNRASGKAPV